MAANVRATRIAQQLSQEKLAKMVGISYQQLQRHETGRDRIGAGRLQQIAAALQVPVTHFFAGPPEDATSDVVSASTGDDLLRFLVSEVGVEFNQAFRRIRCPDTRRDIINLVGSIARQHK
ncbi:helix-turn-helix domain-containing protein [Neorhizobium sp. NPDC001467]|uniref:helix-turn-helix domain-containing protein n=1 Tax=Neorhizobium sp. NPDC001467 TaxID=3390595 RepID=UPI003D06864C